MKIVATMTTVNSTCIILLLLSLPNAMTGVLAFTATSGLCNLSHHKQQGLYAPSVEIRQNRCKLLSVSKHDVDDYENEKVKYQQQSNMKDESFTTGNRRTFIRSNGMIVAAASVSLGGGWWVPRGALAAKGEGANTAMPGVIPSPIKPTGELSKTCAVVALGRDDICLQPLKPPGLYEVSLLQKRLDSLQDGSDHDEDVSAVTKMIQSLMNAEWETLATEIQNQKQKQNSSKLPKGPLKELASACTSGDGSLATKSILKLSEKL